MSKPGYVLNPYTGRMISVGSKVYRRLESESLIKGPIKKNSNIMYEATSKDEARKIKSNLKNDDKTKYLKVRDNKVIKVNKRLSSNDYRDKIVDASARVLKRVSRDSNMASIPDESMNNYLKQQIYKEIVLGNDAPYNIEETSRFSEASINKPRQTKIGKPKKRFVMDKPPMFTDIDTTDIDHDNFDYDEY